MCIRDSRGISNFFRSLHQKFSSASAISTKPPKQHRNKIESPQVKRLPGDGHFLYLLFFTGRRQRHSLLSDEMGAIVTNKIVFCEILIWRSRHNFSTHPKPVVRISYFIYMNWNTEVHQLSVFSSLYFQPNCLNYWVASAWTNGAISKKLTNPFWSTSASA